MIRFDDFIWVTFYFFLFLILLLLLFGLLYGLITKSDITLVINMTLVKFLAYSLFFVLIVFYDPNYSSSIIRGPVNIPWIFHIPNEISLSNLFVAALAFIEAADNFTKFIRKDRKIVKSS